MTPRETNTAGPSASSVRSSIDVPPDLVMGLLGSADENLRALERLLAADLHVRGNAVTLSGEPADVALAERVVAELVAIVAGGQPLTPEGVRRSVAMLVGTGNESPAEVLTLDILSRRGKTIRPKTLNQKRYVDAIDDHTIVFGIGPAGTGKTYLAMAKAVNALQTKQVTRIILTRPAVEAGERLGFLPGTLSEKIDPYLRPLYDALHDMMDPELIPKLMSAGRHRGCAAGVHARPNAQRRVHHPRRGAEHHRRADEDVPHPSGFRLQRSLSPAMSRRSICRAAHRSGLRAAIDILDGIDDIHIAELTSADVVRHRLVSEIVDAYARHEDRGMNRAELPTALSATRCRSRGEA